MSRFTYDLPVGKSHRYHKIDFRVVVEDDGQITVAMREGDRRIQTRLTPGEATKLAGILEAAARVAVQ